MTVKITVTIDDVEDGFQTNRVMEGTGAGASANEQALGNMLMDVIKMVLEPERERIDIQLYLKELWQQHYKPKPSKN